MQWRKPWRGEGWWPCPTAPQQVERLWFLQSVRLEVEPTSGILNCVEIWTSTGITRTTTSEARARAEREEVAAARASTAATTNEASTAASTIDDEDRLGPADEDDEANEAPAKKKPRAE